MKYLAVILVICSVLAGLVGWTVVNQATEGIAVLASACLLAILARIAQARAQHIELMRAVGTRQVGTSTSASAPTAGREPAVPA